MQWTLSRPKPVFKQAYVRSPTALALGVVLGFVTFFVLFEDVLMNGAKITTDHALTLAVILIVAAAGHMWWAQLRSLHVFAAVGLVIAFLAGLFYLVVASGGRNAEVAANKRNAAHFANTERARIKPLLEEAEGMRSSTARKVKNDCVDGKASKKACDGLRTSLAVYEAAVSGHEAALEKLGPPVEENGSFKSTARTLVAFYDVPADQREAAEKRYVERLDLIVPYIKALLVEFGTVLFLGVGIGHRTVSRETVPKAAAATHGTVPQAIVPATVPHGATVLRPSFGRTVPGTVPHGATVPLTQEQALERLLATISHHGTVPQDDLMELFRVRAKSTVSRWCGEWETNGFISRTQTGRCKFVASPQKVAVR